jgi:hypothetical protein
MLRFPKHLLDGLDVSTFNEFAGLSARLFNLLMQIDFPVICCQRQ